MLLTFASTRGVVKAEELLRDAAIKVVAVPLAKNVTAQCGIGLQIDQNDAPEVEKILRDNKIEYSKN